jgi:hypothetical protein
VIHPDSPVGLRWIEFHNREHGFGIVATAEIPEGRPIYELVGAIASGPTSNDSQLSSITTHEHSVHDKCLGTSRILYGPLRFVNHRCLNYNAQVGARCAVNIILKLVSSTSHVRENMVITPTR